MRETPGAFRESDTPRARSSEQQRAGLTREVSAPRIPALIKFHSNFSNYLTHPATRAVRSRVTRYDFRATETRWDDHDARVRAQ